MQILRFVCLKCQCCVIYTWGNRICFCIVSKNIWNWPGECRVSLSPIGFLTESLTKESTRARKPELFLTKASPDERPINEIWENFQQEEWERKRELHKMSNPCFCNVLSVEDLVVVEKADKMKVVVRRNNSEWRGRGEWQIKWETHFSSYR